MKLTFLGTGTSTGVPAIGCDCEVCTSRDKRDKRLRTSAVVSMDDGRQILIDCGPDFRQQALLHPLHNLRGVLLTHHHYDHVGGTDDLRPFCYHFEGGLPVWGKDYVIKDMHRRMPYSFAHHLYPGVPTFKTHCVGDSPFIVDGDIEVTPLPVMHYKLPILGFKIGRLAYITDCKTMPTDTIKLIEGIDTLVINALRHKEHISHLNLTQALDVISVVKPRQAFLTHLSHDMGLHADVEPTLPDGVRIAVDGMTVDISDRDD